MTTIIKDGVVASQGAENVLMESGCYIMVLDSVYTCYMLVELSLTQDILIKL